MSIDREKAFGAKLDGETYWTSEDGRHFVLLNSQEIFKIAIDNVVNSVHLMTDEELSYCLGRNIKDISKKKDYEIINLAKKTVGYETFARRAYFQLGSIMLLPEITDEEYYLGRAMGVSYYAYRIDEEKITKKL